MKQKGIPNEITSGSNPFMKGFKVWPEGRRKNCQRDQPDNLKVTTRLTN